MPLGQPADGVSLVPLLNGAQTTFGDRPLFWHFPVYLQAYQVWDEQRDPLFRSRPCSIIRSGTWKLHEYFEDGAVELYNLADDIGEANDVSAQQPGKTKELVARLNAWRTQINAAVPTALNPEYDAEEEAQAIANMASPGRRKNKQR